MASYGLQVFDNMGNILVDTNTMKGMTLIDTFYVEAGQNYSKSYPEHSDKTIKASAVRVDQSGGHIITISGTTVTATGITLPSEFVVRECASYVYVFAR